MAGTSGPTFLREHDFRGGSEGLSVGSSVGKRFSVMLKINVGDGSV